MNFSTTLNHFISQLFPRLILLPVITLGLLLTSCGINPFGSGMQGGLNLFGKVGQKMERPSSINEEENGKEGSNAVVKEGVASTKRLAKRGANKDPWIVDQGLRVEGDHLIYWEVVKDKPSEEDKDKLMTGRGEVKFGYEGDLPANLEEVDTTKITDVYSFHFIGRENKTWKTFGDHSQIDSVDIRIIFSSTSIQDIKPGRTSFWAKNISVPVELGAGDTASFVLNELNDDKKEQSGEGHFLDAHSGKESNEKPKEFDFDLTIIHKNSEGGNPYLRYQDNEGILTFSLPWGEESEDNLYFNIHFYPEYQRVGTIHKDGPDGPKLVDFEHNEKTGKGFVKIYNEDGEEIDYEETT